MVLLHHPSQGKETSDKCPRVFLFEMEGTWRDIENLSVFIHLLLLSTKPHLPCKQTEKAMSLPLMPPSAPPAGRLGITSSPLLISTTSLGSPLNKHVTVCHIYDHDKSNIDDCWAMFWTNTEAKCGQVNSMNVYKIFLPVILSWVNEKTFSRSFYSQHSVGATETPLCLNTGPRVSVAFLHTLKMRRHDVTKSLTLKLVFRENVTKIKLSGEAVLTFTKGFMNDWGWVITVENLSCL